MDKKGYVSLEVVVVAGLVLAAGIFILVQFILDTDLAGEQAIVGFEDAYVEAIQ